VLFLLDFPQNWHASAKFSTSPVQQFGKVQVEVVLFDADGSDRANTRWLPKLLTERA
jgi:hypothetical protein